MFNTIRTTFINNSIDRARVVSDTIPTNSCFKIAWGVGGVVVEGGGKEVV